MYENAASRSFEVSMLGMLVGAVIGAQESVAYWLPVVDDCIASIEKPQIRVNKLSTRWWRA
jgi:hypothetical protein